jgi:hypothetical protein
MSETSLSEAPASLIRQSLGSEAPKLDPRPLPENGVPIATSGRALEEATFHLPSEWRHETEVSKRGISALRQGMIGFVLAQNNSGCRPCCE